MLHIGFIDDVVPVEHGPGFVTGDLHRDLLGDACGNEVAHSSPAQVVREQAGALSFLESGFPCLADRPDWFAVAVEYVRTNPTGLWRNFAGGRRGVRPDP